MVKIRVMFGELFNTEWQDKTFKDEVACIEWCRKHYAKIGCINDYRTGFKKVSHFDIMDAIKGGMN